MAKKQNFDMDNYLRNNLQSKLQTLLGTRHIENTELPNYFCNSLNPLMPLRPYQKEAFQYFINFMENNYEGKPFRPQLLFHMATGSGKTLIMAGAILYLYQKGYRNFLFFVPSTNVVGKTEDNLFNSGSSKYQFAQTINIAGKRVEIRRVDNFQGADNDCINLCLTTIQALHSDLNTPKEGGVSYNDFSTKGLVLISDEAHHMNGAVKKGNTIQTTFWDDDEFTPTDDWESTVMRIFNRDTEDGMANIMLEFTATEDFTQPGISEKYSDKVIFDYPLRRFRKDGYSKDIAVVQSDASPIDRAIQAMILSQYRRKLFTAIRQNIKPVVMFKSKTIKDNKAFHDEFVQTVKSMTVEDLKRIRRNAKEDILDAFTYIEEKGISYENLLLELQEDFKEENMLLVDGNNITPEKQAYLNSLEDKDNEFRAVFAVDMLNEGWDVLNLYDIVRLYDTRDARQGTVGKTTNAEAQLIGRGARYMPFSVPKVITKKDYSHSNHEAICIFNEPVEEYGKDEVITDTEKEYTQEIDSSLPTSSRKFDNDLTNRLRALETLHYHASHNPRYINELNTALANSGIISANSVTVVEKLKESFKETRLYTDGYVFTNEREAYLINEEITSLGKYILEKDYSVRIKSGDMEQSTVFSKATHQEIESLQQRRMKMKDLGKQIIRAAINRLPEYYFQSLSDYFPNLKSVGEFIESDKYLSEIKVIIIGRKERLYNLSQKDKLFIVMEVLRQITPLLAKGGIGYRGTKLFRPRQIRDVFHDHTFKVQQGTVNKEEGQSIKETTNILLRLNVENAEWFAYDDNFGTEEEKYLIKYLESRIVDLREKYEDIYLLRNHKDLQIFSFRDGRATEPDFVLFMRKRNSNGVYDNIQIFIEPKGEHLRKEDHWKEEFEMDIHKEGYIHFSTPTQKFNIWGMPFYTERYSKEFTKALENNFGI